MVPEQQRIFTELVYKLINEKKQEIKKYEHTLNDICSGQNEYVYTIRKNAYHIGEEPSVLIECKVHSATKPETPLNSQITYCSLNVRYTSKKPKHDAFYAQTNTLFVKKCFFDMQQLSENTGR